MKRNVVSRETSFRARWQLIENRKESILALAGTLSLPHDVYDGKAVGRRPGRSGAARRLKLLASLEAAA